MERSTYEVKGRQFTVYLRDEADKSVAAEIFKLREYRAADEAIIHAVHPILDIGAHSGLFTLYARALNFSIPIVAVEPESKNRELLKKHIAENNVLGVTVVAGAVGAEAGEGTLALSSDTHNHTLLAPGVVAPPGEPVEKVRVFTFSDLVALAPSKRFSVVKLDIEGGEYAFFSGFEDKDFGAVESVIMEYHNYQGHTYREIEWLLREHGFGVQIFPSKFDPKMGFLWAINKRIK